MNLTKEAQRVCMDKRRSAVFGRLFSFIAVFAILTLCFALLSACDVSEVSSLFTPNEDFQVTFVLNNGEDNIVWRSGESVPNPTKEGYKFVGWCNDITLGSVTSLDFDSLNLSQSIVLYAKWEELPDITGVIFEDAEVVYDGLIHTLEVSNLPSGASVVYDSQNSYINVGKYTVNAYVTLDDYKDLSLSATLTINKASVSGISFEDKEVDWNGEKHSIEIDGTLPKEVSVRYTNNAQSEVGQYKVIAHFYVSDNYEPIEDMSATLTINEVYFLVSFVNGNGNVYAESVAHGCDVRNIPKLYEKDGYIASWESKKTTDIYSNLVVNAVYTPITYTISFVSVGDVVNEVEYNIENGVDFATWQRDCYTFGGWYTDELCSGKRVNGISKGNMGDKTYYAKWTPIEYTVKYHLNGGINDKQNVNDTEDYVYTVESSRLELAEPTKLHYVFEGWYANANFTGMKWSYLPKGASGNKDFYAKWSPEKYSVEYRLDGGENHKDNPSGYNYESTCITLLPATRQHYDFVCWRNEKNEAVDRIADGTYGDVVLIADWKAIEHTIYLLNEDGTSRRTIAYTIESDDIKLESQLEPYCTFVGWFDEDGNKITTISPSTAKDVYVYAKFNAIEYEIKYYYNGGTGENVTTYTVASEDIVLNEPTRDYYTFIGWYNGNEKVEVIKKGSHGNIILQAQWQATEYSIAYYGANDTTDYVTSYTVEDENIVLQKPQKDFYKFDGWYSSQDLSGDAMSEICTSAPQNYSLYAKFTPIEYYISYDFNGGSEVENPTSYTIENSDIVLVEPSKEYYTFLGWYNEFGDRVDIVNKGSHGNLALCAEWEPIEYTVYLYNEDGTVHGTIVYTIESDDIVPYNVLKEYYDFVGWFDKDGDKVEKISASEAKDIHLYVKFKATEYTIRYAYNGGKGENVTTYTIESADIILNEATRDYYIFQGWYSGDDKVEIIKGGSHGNVTLQATWQAVEYTIAYFGIENTIGYVTSYTVEGENISLPTPNKDYYNFAGWYTNSDYNGDAIAEIQTSAPQNYSLYAKFTPIEYRICYILNGGDEVDNPTVYTVESDTITLLSPNKANHTFDGWYNSNGRRLSTIAKGSYGDLVLEARWTSDLHTITYIGVQDVSSYPTTYSIEGGDVTLPTPSKDYYEFVGWYENADFDGEKVAVIKADSTKDYVLYPRFAPIEYAISYEYNGGLDAQNPTAYTIESEKILLKDTSKAHYDFIGWYLDGKKVDGIEQGSHGNMHFEAKFEPVKYTIAYRNIEDSSSFVATYTIEDGEITLQTPQKDFYNFDGWYLSEDFGGNAIEKLNASENGNVILYAKFTPIVYTIEYCNADTLENDNKTSYTVEDEDFALLDVTKDDFEFLGWYDKQTDERVSTIDTSLAKNITLVAKWKEQDVPTLSSPFVVDENGCLTGIYVDLLDDKTLITVPSSVNGVRVKSIASGVFESIKADIKQIEIAEGVTSIASDLFTGMSVLEKLTLPSTIEVMHKGMLTDCISLCDLTVPFASFCIDDENDITGTKYTKDISGDNSVGLMFLFGEPEDATNCTAVSVYKGNDKQYCTCGAFHHFYLPKSLKNVTVLGGDISARAFYELKTITSITLESGVSYVGSLAFAKAYGLEQIVIKGGEVSFESNTFTACNDGKTDLTIHVANESIKAEVVAFIETLGLTNVSVVIDDDM